ncbi:MAG: MarR family winged helix-turn-helix transcriptional regulator [Albidovulum sp.]
MNEARGITAARRAVMEHLANNQPMTVPQVAEAKSVSRQHIQTVADELVALGLACWSDNPAHRRSRLLGLTDQGTALFADIRAEEDKLIEGLAAELDDVSVAAGLRSLEQLVAGLRRLQRNLQHGQTD